MKRGRGRPKKPAAARLADTIFFRMLDSEVAALRRRAESVGLPLHEYVRSLVRSNLS